MNKFLIKLNGLSMTPLLCDQDEIQIESLNISDLKYGDIVLFLDQSSKKLTIHRLIDFPLKTKGDFSLLAEENSIDSCLGKATGIRRGNVYWDLPCSNSLFNTLFLFLSEMRMKGYFLRKLALALMIILTKVFVFCSDKTISNHNEVPTLNDL